MFRHAYMDDVLFHAMNTSMIPVYFANEIVKMVMAAHVLMIDLNIDRSDPNGCMSYSHQCVE